MWILSDEGCPLKLRGWSGPPAGKMQNCLFLLQCWTPECNTWLILSWPAIPASRPVTGQNCLLPNGNTYRNLQRICSRFASWEGQLQSKSVVWWPACRRSLQATDQPEGWVEEQGRRVLGDTLTLWPAQRWAPDQPCELKPCEGGGTAGLVFREVPRQGAQHPGGCHLRLPLRAGAVEGQTWNSPFSVWI